MSCVDLDCMVGDYRKIQAIERFKVHMYMYIHYVVHVCVESRATEGADRVKFQFGPPISKLICKIALFVSFSKQLIILRSFRILDKYPSSPYLHGPSLTYYTYTHMYIICT